MKSADYYEHEEQRDYTRKALYNMKRDIKNNKENQEDVDYNGPGKERVDDFIKNKSTYTLYLSNVSGLTGDNIKEIMDYIAEKNAINRLKTLYISSNDGIHDLPDLSNTHIEYLDCSMCDNLFKITSLPNTLKTLNASFSGIGSLPYLSNTHIEDLNCGFCENLQSVPYLPRTLKELIISASQINKLPNLEHTNLEILNCDFCRSLNSIGSLPNTFKVLIANYSGIMKLPDMIHTQLEHLECTGCVFLEHIPPLPNSVTNIYISDTKVSIYTINKLIQKHKSAKITTLFDDMRSNGGEIVLNQANIKKLIKQKRKHKRTGKEFFYLKEFFTLAGSSLHKISLFNELMFQNETIEINFGKQKKEISFPKNINIYSGLARTIDKFGDKHKSLNDIIKIYEQHINAFIESGKKYMDVNNKKDNYVFFVNHPVDNGAFTRSNNDKIKKYYKSLIPVTQGTLNDYISMYENGLSREQWNKEIEKIHDKLEEGKQVFVYLGGHGGREGDIIFGSGSEISKKDFKKLFSLRANGNLMIMMTSCNSGFKYDDLHKLARKQGITLVSDSSLHIAWGGNTGSIGTLVKGLDYDSSGYKYADYDGDNVVNPHEAALYMALEYNSSLTPIVMPQDSDNDGNIDDYIPISDVGDTQRGYGSSA